MSTENTATVTARKTTNVIVENETYAVTLERMSDQVIHAISSNTTFNAKSESAAIHGVLSARLGQRVAKADCEILKVEWSTISNKPVYDADEVNADKLEDLAKSAEGAIYRLTQSDASGKDATLDLSKAAYSAKALLQQEGITDQVTNKAWAEWYSTIPYLAAVAKKSPTDLSSLVNIGNPAYAPIMRNTPATITSAKTLNKSINDAFNLLAAELVARKITPSLITDTDTFTDAVDSACEEAVTFALAAQELGDIFLSLTEEEISDGVEPSSLDKEAMATAKGVIVMGGAARSILDMELSKMSDKELVTTKLVVAIMAAEKKAAGKDEREAAAQSKKESDAEDTIKDVFADYDFDKAVSHIAALLSVRPDAASIIEELPECLATDFGVE